jgi:hypothetical protein
VNNPDIIISRIGTRVVTWSSSSLFEILEQLRQERSEHYDRELESLITLAEEVKLRTSNEIIQGHAVHDM